MLPEGFPLIPESVPIVSFGDLILWAAGILVVVVAAIIWADRSQHRTEARGGIISELPPPERKAA